MVGSSSPASPRVSRLLSSPASRRPWGPGWRPLQQKVVSMINAFAIYSESAANFPLQVVSLACLTAGALVRLPGRLRPAIAEKHAVRIRQFQDSDVVLPEDAARLDSIDTRPGRI